MWVYIRNLVLLSQVGFVIACLTWAAVTGSFGHTSTNRFSARW